MSCIVLTGASGFLGHHLIPLLRADGLRVRALSRQTAEPMPGVEWIAGDLGDPDIWDRLLEPDCTVIHLAYAPQPTVARAVEHVQAMVAGCARVGIRRLVHCSTISVFGRTGGGLIDERTPCQPTDDYGRQKLAIERAFTETVGQRFELAVLRPAAVFGAGGHGLQALCHSLLHRSRLVNYARASLFGQRQMHLVPVETVVAALDFLRRHEGRLRGEVFIVGEDEDPANRFRRVEQVLMAELGVPDYPVAPLPVPGAVLGALLRLRGRSEVDPFCTYSSARLRAEGFRPALALVPALQALGARQRARLAHGESR